MTVKRLLKKKKASSRRNASHTRGRKRAILLSEPINDSSYANGSIAELLINAAPSQKQGIYFVAENGEEIFYSYNDILTFSQQRLMGMRCHGIKSKSLAIIALQDSAEFVLTFWACMLGGITAVPVSYPTTFNEKNKQYDKFLHIWCQLGKPVIIADNNFIKNYQKITTTDESEQMKILVSEQLVVEDDFADLSMGAGDDIAIIQYSSGSTGDPKGVTLTHKNLLTNIRAMLMRMKVKPKDKYLSWMPYHHDMGLIGFHLTPVAAIGTQINMSPATFLRRPMLWLKKLHEHRVAYTGSPNFGYRHVLDNLNKRTLETLDLSCVKLIFNGAEPISAGLMQRFMEVLSQVKLSPRSMFPVYGMAEASLGVTFPIVDSDPEIYILKRSALVGKNRAIKCEEGDADAIQIVCEGVPLPATNIRIVNDRGALVNQGTLGNIQIRGENVTKGYFNNDDANHSSFQDKWLKTGDLGCIIDGKLFVTGRSKDIIFVNGQNYFAYDVEACAEQVSGVLVGRVAACGWHNDKQEKEQVVLFVNVRPPKDSDKSKQDICAEIVVHINNVLGVPIDFVVLGVPVPKTTSGKIQRYSLLQEFLEGGYEEQTLTRRALLFSNAKSIDVKLTDTEQKVRRLWAEILGVDEELIDPDRGFRELGGSSVKAVQMLNLLENEFSDEFGHELLLNCRTTREVAAFVNKQQDQISKGEAAEKKPSTKRQRIGSHADNRIAIISMACHFPDAVSPEQFWNNISHGKDSVMELPVGRWHMSATAEGDGEWEKTRGGFIDGVYNFDADFFNIEESEALILDPQQRIMLELAWEILERAGYTGCARQQRNIGVFIGASYNGYLEYHRHSLDQQELQSFDTFQSLTIKQQEALLSDWSSHFGKLASHPNSAVDNLLNMIAARISHYLDLKGPSLTVDTACSSSLVSVHLAAESLRRGECDMAIAGGINLLLTSTPFKLFNQSGALSPSGKCWVFDAQADGFVPGEGGGLVLLKRLKDAIADGDEVLAVIAAEAVNNDGRSLGVMAPNPDGQREVIEAVYHDNGIAIDDVLYVEAHGTGTPIGDPSEVRALNQVFSAHTTVQGRRVIGSVKANIGHLLSAAGIASLIKVVMALNHKTLPPSINYTTPNKQINLENTVFEVITKERAWDVVQGRRRMAAINSFGFGGTNCHMVLEEAPQALKTIKSTLLPDKQLFCLSARNESTLLQYLDDFSAYLQRSTDIDLSALCAELRNNRAQFKVRTTLPVASIGELKTALTDFNGPLETVANNGKLVLMFTGQGAQYPGAARKLYETLPQFKRYIDECDEAFSSYLDKPLSDYVYAEQASQEVLNDTRLTQPVTFAFDYAVGRLLLDCGVKPDYVMGHSIGEYAAACVSGVFSLADAAKLVAERGRLMAALPSAGAMAAVFADAQTVHIALKKFDGDVWVAGYNGSHCVIAGKQEALAHVEQQFMEQGKTVTRLRVSNAFHTPLMKPMLENYSTVLASVVFQPPKIAIISTVIAEQIGERITEPDYWLQHILDPVCFEQGVEYALSNNATLFVEAGSHKVLSNLVQAIAPQVSVYAVLDKKQDDLDNFLVTLAALYRKGLMIDWQMIYGDTNTRQSGLPSYPFQHVEYRPYISASCEHRPTRRSVAALFAEGDHDEGLRYEWQWQTEPLISTSNTDSIHRLLLCDPQCQQMLIDTLTSRYGKQLTLIYPGETYECLAENQYQINPAVRQDYVRLLEEVEQANGCIGQIIHGWNYRPWEADVLLAPNDVVDWSRYVNSGILLGQVLLERAVEIQILFVTAAANIVFDEQLLGPHQSLPVTFLLAAAEESPLIRCRAIDLEAGLEGNIVADLLAQEFDAKDSNANISWRSGMRFSRVIRGWSSHFETESYHCHGKTYLITGGASGVGAKIAKTLAVQGAKNLILTGTHPLPDTTTAETLMDSKAHKRLNLIKELLGYGTNAIYRAVDVADEQAMVKLLAEVTRRYGAIHGVVHAAGYVDRETVLAVGKSEDGISRVLRPKVIGVQVLDKVTSSQPLDWFVLFSSIAATAPRWGAGLSDYAAANAYLDSFSSYRNSQTCNGRTLAINWSLWGETGMAEDPSLGAIIQEQGLQPLTAETATREFLDLLSSSITSVVHVIARTKVVAQLTVNDPAIKVESVQRETLGRQNSSRALVEMLICEQLNIVSSDISWGCNFRDIGLDSVAAVEMVQKLNVKLGGNLYPTLLFEHQTPERLVTYLDSLDEQEKVTSLNQGAGKEHTTVDDDIAIIGYSCRFPGADSVEEYAQLLYSNEKAVTDMPLERWDSSDFYQKEESDRTSYTRKGGFINNPYDFDPLFFGISPREASLIDPQQRLFLAVAWEALQSSCYGNNHRTHDIGVFVGCEHNTYGEHYINYPKYKALQERLCSMPWFQKLPEQEQASLFSSIADVFRPGILHPDAVAGNGLNEIAARLSHWLDLTGPSMAVNTACSSSLVALHLACNSLHAGECKMALVGGASLNLSPTPFILLSQVRALSKEGACHPFDAAADGMVLGEGVASILIKPLKEALKDGDVIHGVIKGSAVNNDGHSQGLTAPNPKGQAEVVRKAYQRSGINPRSVSYIEAHGTGTPLGDPIEIEGLSRAFRIFTDETQFCALGSVKSTIGHLLSASGLSSLIKVLIAMQRESIPPTRGYKKPNPHINFASSPFSVVGETARPWARSEQPRRAGVNAFGFGGTNCHIILEEPPQSQIQCERLEGAQLLLLSGRNEAVLTRVAARLETKLNAEPTLALDQLCLSMNMAQRRLPYRTAMLVRSRTQLSAHLKNIQQGDYSAMLGVARSNPRSNVEVNLLLGDGLSFTPEERVMLGRWFPAFSEVWQTVATHTGEMDSYNLADQYALIMVLVALGIRPRLVVAQGFGLLIAAVLAGILSIEQAAILFQGKTVNVSEKFTDTDDVTVVTANGVVQEPSELLAMCYSWRSSQPVPASVCQNLTGESTVWVSADSSVNVDASGAVPCLRLMADSRHGAVDSLLTLIGKLYVNGVDIDVTKLYNPAIPKVTVPTYPYENKIYRHLAATIQPQDIKPLPDGNPSKVIEKRGNITTTLSGELVLQISTQLPVLTEQQRKSIYNLHAKELLGEV